MARFSWSHPLTESLVRLLDIMARLRDPARGCPWDVEQTFATIVPYTIEEAYEVADAIERDDRKALREELGDLLLQVVFHARMAEEEGSFAFDDVAAAIADKLVRRHPHVFAGAAGEDAAAVKRSWETIKADERGAKATASGARASALDDVPRAQPALMRAEKLGKRAARIGFDWPDVYGVLAKVREEIGEVEAELAQGEPRERTEAEIGDVLFSVAQLARRLDIDPETALRGANARFERRFRAVEDKLAQQGRIAADAPLDELEALWQAAKVGEKDF
ncbi:MAG: nucleoside triphosphate pyrophosphohydrolase [Alphaproteobacteria bacterium]|nr:nucleoside triphosphate pyrophosphohydrolase [Alphaproteobacteria bacterium]